MIVWGGDESLETARAPFDTGGHYDLAQDRWHPTETRGAPAGRTAHTAIWTGKEMVVWGGAGAKKGLLGDGASYDPRARSWTLLSNAGAPSPRRGHVAIWTGTEMIIWGGEGKEGRLNDGARWSRSTGEWRPISKVGAPSARWLFAAVWTRDAMLIWGGADAGKVFADGAAYDPIADRWRPLTGAGAPSARFSPVGVWTGQEMLVWGGRAEPQGDDISGGAAYRPSSDRWRVLEKKGSKPRTGLIGVWTGKALLTVGEPSDDDEVYPPREGGLFTPGAAWTMFHVGFGWPDATIVWTGKVALAWGGFDGTNVQHVGVRIEP